MLRLWFMWILATTVGFAVGGAVGGGLGSVLADMEAERRLPVAGETYWALQAAAIYVPVGALAGALQWLVLRRALPGTRWWTWLSIAGYALGSVAGVKAFFLAGRLEGLDDLIAAFASGGFTIGVLQWSTLRVNTAKAGWWILANTVLFPLAFVPALLRFRFLSYLGWYEVYVKANIDSVVTGGIAGIVVGTVTGAVLVWLLARPIPKDRASERAVLMFERFTERARRVIILSQEEAKRLNHSAVGTEHILLGIIREGEGVASKVLESLNISPKRVRAEIEGAIGRGERQHHGEVAFTTRVEKVLELAMAESRRLSHNYIGTEHLLLGLIRDGEGVATRVLEAMGAELNRVRAQVLYLLGEEGTTSYTKPAGTLPTIEQIPGEAFATRATLRFERFTEPARGVIILAREEAKRLNHSRVGPEHILLGIIREGEGVASKVLESLNISPKRVRAEIEGAIGWGARAPHEEVAFTPRAKKVLKRALDEARRLGHKVGTEHLLLGLIREGEGVAVRVLDAMGADLDRVRAQVVLLGQEETDARTSLERVSLFSGLPGDMLAGLAARFRRRTFGKGTMIFRKDQVDDALYIVESGRVRIFLQTDDGRELALDAGPGDVLGEMELLGEHPHCASAIALEDTVASTLSREEFHGQLKASPATASAFLAHLSTTLESLAFRVTFLFTDIEGSTRHLVWLGEGFTAVVADYRSIVRSLFVAYRGQEVKDQGDGFFYAFPRPRDALEAAVAVQRAISTHSWPDALGVDARMGIDTYVGTVIHRAVRIGAAAHGGQVLLSQATRELIGGDLPDGVTLRDLGEHRLHGFSHPQRIFQVVVPDLPSEFPSLAGPIGV